MAIKVISNKLPHNEEIEIIYTGNLLIFEKWLNIAFDLYPKIKKINYFDQNNKLIRVYYRNYESLNITNIYKDELNMLILINCNYVEISINNIRIIKTTKVNNLICKNNMTYELIVDNYLTMLDCSTNYLTNLNLPNCNEVTCLYNNMQKIIAPNCKELYYDFHTFGKVIDILEVSGHCKLYDNLGIQIIRNNIINNDLLNKCLITINKKINDNDNMIVSVFTINVFISLIIIVLLLLIIAFK